MYSATNNLRYTQSCNDFNDFSSNYMKSMNLFDRFNSTLQEHNSYIFNSQKENMMQVINVKKVVEAELIDEIYEPALNQKSDKLKVQEASILSLKKQKDFNRTLEAFSDCV